MDKNNNPLVTVGIPVFNGEKYIRKAIDSILAQTFSNFNCIISDNGSTDQTEIICKEYEKKDERITYVRHEKNGGPDFNFRFVLSKAKSKYFVWLAYDDYWESTFLEKNTAVLEKNHNFVGSIGIVKFYGIKDFHINKKIVFKIKNKMRRGSNDQFEKYAHVRPVSGIYEEKVSTYLRFNQASFVYGLFRTDKLQNRMVSADQVGWDLLLILNILKDGDLHVIDEILLYRFVSGYHSGFTYFGFYKKKLISLTELIFPGATLFMWCSNNVGKKFIIKNLDWFLLVLVYGWFQILKEVNNKIFKN
jgi:glycosyltransferase involved in cell wall biosynthesis